MSRALSYSIFSKCGHQPALVDRVAGEAAAEMVVHAAGGHGVEGGQGGVERRRRHRCGRWWRSSSSIDMAWGNFGRPTEAAPAGVVLADERAGRLVQPVPVGQVVGGLEPVEPPDGAGQPPGLLVDGGSRRCASARRWPGTARAKDGIPPRRTGGK